jgi:Rrf2 family protein
MLTISRETDYAARIILHLALQSPTQRVTAQEIAHHRLIPPSLVRRLVTRLATAGLLATTRGIEGGIALARPAAQISLLDVVEAIEGPLVLNTCTEEPQFCPLMATCTVHEAWVRARRMLEAELRAVTFDQLARQEGGN